MITRKKYETVTSNKESSNIYVKTYIKQMNNEINSELREQTKLCEWSNPDLHKGVFVIVGCLRLHVMWRGL